MRHGPLDHKIAPSSSFHPVPSSATSVLGESTVVELVIEICARLKAMCDF